MDTSGFAIAKYLLLFFNVVFAISGVILVSVGAHTFSYVHEMEEFMISRLYSFPVSMIVIGTLVFSMCVLGFCGAVRRSSMLLYVYGVMLFVVFLFELIGGIVTVLTTDGLFAALKGSVTLPLDRYIIEEAYKKSWDSIQKSKSCCGVLGPSDWHVLNIQVPYAVPPSCCDSLIVAGVCSPTYVYKNGCLDLDGVTKALMLSGGVVIGLMLLQLVGISIVFLLNYVIRNQRQRRQAKNEAMELPLER